MNPLILASTSPYRRALLERLGLPFECRTPSVDESAVAEELVDRSPGSLAMHLAQAKARSVAALFPLATVIGSDQVVALDGTPFHKPGHREQAIRQLQQLSGRTHLLVTAVAVLHAGGIKTLLEKAHLTMRKLGPDELARYVDHDQPFDCAGSYKLEQRGITLFEKVETSDHTTITGLPLIGLSTLLRDLGYPIP